jgi:hypothetical protein
MEDTLFSLYVAGSIPLLIILMYIIGKATPSDIIKDTVDFYPTEREIYLQLQTPNLILTIFFFIVGLSMAILYALFKPDNLSGFAIIGFAVTLFAFLLTGEQVQRQTEFTNKLLSQIKLKINYSDSINDYVKIENLLYISRILLFIGIEIIIYGVVLLNLDNPVWNLWFFQLRYLVMVGIGYGIMNFGWILERTAMNWIIQPQILVKIRSCN